jgi:hypothetical protein
LNEIITMIKFFFSSKAMPRDRKLFTHQERILLFLELLIFLSDFDLSLLDVLKAIFVII